jgi:hypothetical protein
MNDQPIETQGWRDQSPRITLKGEILEKALASPASRRFSPFAAGIVGSGIGVVALSAVMLFSTAPISLAQVIAADEKAESITIVNKRIMGEDKGNGFTVTTKSTSGVTLSTVVRSGSKSPESWGYSDKQNVIRYMDGYKLAVFDAPGAPTRNIRRLKASEILKDFKAAKVEKNFDWNGRKVIRFTYKAKLRTTDVDEELLVDPKTNLPIRFISMRDNGSWGDEWNYDYSKLDAKALKPKISSETEVIDNRKVRAKMQEIVSASKSQIPLVEVGPAEIGVLVPADWAPKKGDIKFEIKLSTKDGSEKVFSGTTSPVNPQTTQVGRHRFLALIANQFDSYWKDKSFGDKVSGSVTVNGKKHPFSDLPVVKTGYLYFINNKSQKKSR